MIMQLCLWTGTVNKKVRNSVCSTMCAKANKWPPHKLWPKTLTEVEAASVVQCSTVAMKYESFTTLCALSLVVKNESRRR